MIDQYIEVPEEGWPRWMEQQIELSNFVVIGYNTKFIPVIFDGDSYTYIPKPLKGTTFYNISNKKDLRKLALRILGVKNNKKPPLGANHLDVINPKTIFISPFINNKMWEKANWISTSYIGSVNNECPPRIMLFFKEDKFAKWIFQDLLRLESNGYIDALDVAFILGKKEQAKYWLKIAVRNDYFKEYLRLNTQNAYLVISQNLFKEYNIDFHKDPNIIYIKNGFEKYGYVEMTYITLHSSSNIVLKIRNVTFKELDKLSEDDLDYKMINKPQPYLVN